MIGLSEIFKTRGFEPTKESVKIVRHKRDGLDLEMYVRRGWLETYQSFQGKPRFDGLNQIISFIGEEGLMSRFVGVYDVVGRIPATEAILPVGCPEDVRCEASGYFYILRKRSGFEDLEDRLVIGWPPAAVKWQKPFRDCEIVEIRRQGRTLEPFRDYLQVDLTFDELRQLMANPDAHQDWKSGLSAVGAIYLIVNNKTGQQYVGSATGVGGLWQRWSDYAKNGGHGGNILLKEACTLEGGGPHEFRYSILETLSKTRGRADAQRTEAFFKKKLGTRAFGLNAN
jgi:hypothetical protein